MLEIKLTDFSETYTKEEIIHSLKTISLAYSKFYSSIPLDIFFTQPSDAGWSPKKNLDHLGKAINAVTLGLISPKFSLLIFGTNDTASKKMSAIIETYLGKLSSGSKAGIFTPIEIFQSIDLESKNKALASFEKSINKFSKSILNWDESELEKYKLPHPILGNITAREMILFSIYHLFHHTEKVAKRLS